MQHYYAIAEAGENGSWWISLPGRDGITSAADDATPIVAQAQDALESAAMHDGRLPPAIEDGASPPIDLSDFRCRRWSLSSRSRRLWRARPRNKGNEAIPEPPRIVSAGTEPEDDDAI